MVPIALFIHTTCAFVPTAEDKFIKLLLLTVVAIVLDVAGESVAQVAVDVITTATELLSTNVVVV